MSLGAITSQPAADWMLDGKPLGAIHVPSPIPDDTLVIPVGFASK